jgi:hypothetical protein
MNTEQKLKSVTEIKAKCTNFQIKFLENCLRLQKAWENLTGTEADKTAYRKQSYPINRHIQTYSRVTMYLTEEKGTVPTYRP